MLALQPAECKTDVIEPNWPGRFAEIPRAITATKQIQEQNDPTILGQLSCRMGNHPPTKIQLVGEWMDVENRTPRLELRRRLV